MIELPFDLSVELPRLWTKLRKSFASNKADSVAPKPQRED